MVMSAVYFLRSTRLSLAPVLGVDFVHRLEVLHIRNEHIDLYDLLLSILRFSI